jgi:hypothetical protein
MRITKVSTTLVVHACPKGSIKLLEQVAGIALKWSQQKLLSGTQSASTALELSWLEAEELMSKLHSLQGLYLDLIQQGAEKGILYMLCPGFGIFRAETSLAGEIMLTEDRIWGIVQQAQGNQRELQRLLRLALGQNWDDLLEPFRAQRLNDNVVLLNRAV